MKKCNCHIEEALKVMYDPIEGFISKKTIGRCLGTKEYDICSCNGDESKCDFYPEKRVGKATFKYDGHKKPNFDFDFSGYESPIAVHTAFVTESIKEQQEGVILEAVQKIGVDVDKEELLKALTYDREQYEKGAAYGYEQGYKNGWDAALEYVIARFKRNICGEKNEENL